MRVAVLALLWALASCDQVFGIERTQPWDAQLPIDAPNWKTSITWQTFADGQVTYDPIDGLAVQVGVLDLGSDVTTTSPLMSLAVDATGQFQVPYELAFAPYRVVFTAPDGVPTEIQTALRGFAWGFPIYGRHDRDSAAPGATFSGTVTGVTGGAAPIRLFTTGLWSVTEGATAGGSGAFSFAYGSGLSLSGTLGVPSGSAGDLAIVLLGTGSGTLASATGFAVFPGGIGNAGTEGYQTATPTSITWPTGANSAAQASRLANQLAGFGTALPAYYAWGGAIPDTKMPSFVQPAGAALGSNAAAAMAAIPPPVMLPLDERGASTGASFVNPFAGSAAGSATLAMYEGVIATRAGSAASITSPTYLPASLQSVTPVDATNMATPPLGAGIAVSNGGATTFGGIALAADGVAIARGTAATLPLVFGADRAVDDCAVTLYRVVDDPSGIAATLHPIARFIAMGAPAQPNPPLMIATQLFDTSSVYTFGIHCELGHDLSNNDYRAATYPFSASTAFSTLFTVP